MTEKILTFAHISDTHLHIDPAYTMEGVPYPALPRVQAMIDYLNNFEAEIDLVLHTGDVMHNPAAPEEYATIREILDGIRYPTYYTTGNHDRVAWFQEHFIGRTGDAILPTYDTEFEVNGVQFLLLDSHTPPDIRNAVGVFSAEQLAWLRERTQADDPRPLVVGVHHHALPLLAPWLDRIGTTNGEDFHAALLPAKHRLRGVFYGHIHETLVTARDGIVYYSTQSGWFQTRTYHNQAEPARDPLENPGFNLVTLTERDTFVRVIRVPLGHEGA